MKVQPLRMKPQVRADVAVMGALDRSFVSDIHASVSPSVALIMPRGVRNSTAQGSGFAVAVHNVSYILTSAHVAAGGMSVEVALPGDGFKERYNATVVGRAPGGEDIALLSLPDDAPPLPLLDFGDSNALRPGEFVVALGHPSGMRGAVSLGVLSGRSELPAFCTSAVAPDELGADSAGSDDDGSAAVQYLVTDAAFAGGMSGGPLCGDDGLVYGVNTLVDGRLRGLGNLAIASNRVRVAAEAIASLSAAKGSACFALRLVLFNDQFNKRARVEKVLTSRAGLSAEAAKVAMMGAHTTGRGVVRVFEASSPSEEDAEEDAEKEADGAGSGAGGAPLPMEMVEEAEALLAKLAAEDLLVELERVY